jgi:hypothetical protein
MITNGARCTRGIKFRIALTKTALSKMKVLFSCQLDFNLRKKLVNCDIWIIVLCGAENLDTSESKS